MTIDMKSFEGVQDLDTFFVSELEKQEASNPQQVEAVLRENEAVWRDHREEAIAAAKSAVEKTGLWTGLYDYSPPKEEMYVAEDSLGNRNRNDLVRTNPITLESGNMVSAQARKVTFSPTPSGKKIVAYELLAWIGDVPKVYARINTYAREERPIEYPNDDGPRPYNAARDQEVVDILKEIEARAPERTQEERDQASGQI